MVEGSAVAGWVPKDFEALIANLEDSQGIAVSPGRRCRSFETRWTAAKEPRGRRNEHAHQRYFRDKMAPLPEYSIRTQKSPGSSPPPTGGIEQDTLSGP